MLVRGATKVEIERALALINNHYHGNLRFLHIEPEGKGFRVRLAVFSSRGPGARRGFQRTKSGERRRTSSACWHAHGDFIDALPETARVTTALNQGRGIHQVEHGGDCRWTDRQVGSYYQPVMMSELCDCGKKVKR